MTDGETLIEYRYYEHRLGYLVVELIEGKVLVKTFLFLTMGGTPEGNCLRKRLRFCKQDMIETRLDNLYTFALTDVVSDPDLRGLLTECGCGHLLDMATAEARRKLAQGYARDIRNYIGMRPL